MTGQRNEKEKHPVHKITSNNVLISKNLNVTFEINSLIDSRFILDTYLHVTRVTLYATWYTRAHTHGESNMFVIIADFPIPVWKEAKVGSVIESIRRECVVVFFSWFPTYCIMERRYRNCQSWRKFQNVEFSRILPPPRELLSFYLYICDPISGSHLFSRW